MKRIITWRPGMKVSARSKGRVQRQQLEKWRMQAGWQSSAGKKHPRIGMESFKKHTYPTGEKLTPKRYWWSTSRGFNKADFEKMGRYSGINKSKKRTSKLLDKLHRIAVKEGWRSK